MSEHVGEALADLVAGRCAPERRREIEEHLQECAECAAQRSWVEQLRDDAIREGLGHLSTMRLVQLGAGDSGPTPLEHEHLGSCDDCRQELSWARQVPDAGTLAGESGLPSSTVPDAARLRLSWGPWAWAGVGVAAVTVILLVLVPGRRPADLSGLARIEPLAVEMTRAPMEPGTFEAALLGGLTAYDAGNYSAARERLLEALALRKDDTASLYLGSTELLLGEFDAATSRLRRTADDALDPFVREEALWQLANGELLRDRVERSREILERLIRLAGFHKADAEQLLTEIVAAQEDPS